MRKLSFILALFLTAQAYAQVETNWKTPVEGNPKSIYFHQFTLTPIVETSSYYYGINTIDKTVLWTIKKSEKLAALQTARTASALTGSDDMTKGLDLVEYVEIPNTQFASISNNLIDISSGKILLGESSNPYKSLLAYDIIPQLNILLLKVKAEDGSQKLHGVDIATSEVLWSTKLAEGSLAKDALAFAAKANGLDQLTINLFQPAATASGDIIYNNNGKLALINSKTGVITWENDCNPATFFLNKSQGMIISIQRPSAASSAMSIRGPKPFGKKVTAIDAATGKNIWAEPTELEDVYKMHSFLNDNEVLIANSDGVNLYDLKSGKNLWKKDFEAKNIKSMELKSEGLELQYGNKLMLIDSKTGKKIWKKEIELEGIDENADYDVYRKDYKNVRILMTPGELFVNEKATGKKVWSKGFDEEARVAFDDANNKILIISKKKIFLFNPDEQKKAPKAIELKIENPKEIAGYEIKGSNYFIYGQKEFILIDKDGKLIDRKEYPQLQGNVMKRAVLTAATITSAAMSTRIETVDSKTGKVVGESGVFVDPATAKSFEEAGIAQNDMRKSLKANDKMRRAVRTDGKNAYFLKGESKDGSNLITLVIVDKATGKEVKNIDFSKNRDIVYEIDLSNGMLYFVDNGFFNLLNL